MSLISGIADHFLSPRRASEVKRIAVVEVEETLPASFLTANLALKWAVGEKRVMAIEGKEGGTDLGNLLWRKPLPLLGEGDDEPHQEIPRPREIDLVPFRLTPSRLQFIRPSQWERLKRQEENADLLLITLPGDGTLFSWTSILRSLHAVVLQVPAQERILTNCYRILRFFYLHNPFLRVHFVGVLCLEKGAKTTLSDGMKFYEQLSWLVARFLHQDLIGPHLLLMDRNFPDQRFSSLNSLLDHLSQKLLTEEPFIDRTQFSRLFDSLETMHCIPPASRWERSDLFKRLGDYFPLDVTVGPKRVTLLLNWERRLAVGEVATEGLGDALVRGIEAMEWAHNHLPLLASLYTRKLDPALSPHLVLISPEYPSGFCGMVTRLGLPIVLYQACKGQRGIHVVQVSSPVNPPCSPELSSEEEEALKGNESPSPDHL